MRAAGCGYRLAQHPRRISTGHPALRLAGRSPEAIAAAIESFLQLSPSGEQDVREGCGIGLCDAVRYHHEIAVAERLTGAVGVRQERAHLQVVAGDELQRAS